MYIDHFKSVNDTWGHPVGDIIIKIVSDAIREVLRVGDTAYRFGGEEMVVLLSNGPTEEDLLNIGNRMRETVTRKVEEDFDG